ncbi:hypothetical protein NE237_016419 [Protea cynaroides]|uniref:Uncharacterized protein n=1 Tax=Protea cynaroides TaxID=273540 RepID=A0A9Q0HH21_9MAGN|nr:hypothetical protein NE237_016419 [Protea cynaroides]
MGSKGGMKLSGLQKQVLSLLVTSLPLFRRFLGWNPMGKADSSVMPWKPKEAFPNNATSQPRFHFQLCIPSRRHHCYQLYYAGFLKYLTLQEKFVMRKSKELLKGKTQMAAMLVFGYLSIYGAIGDVFSKTLTTDSNNNSSLVKLMKSEPAPTPTSTMSRSDPETAPKQNC